MGSLRHADSPGPVLAVNTDGIPAGGHGMLCQRAGHFSGLNSGFELGGSFDFEERDVGDTGTLSAVLPAEAVGSGVDAAPGEGVGLRGVHKRPGRRRNAFVDCTESKDSSELDARGFVVRSERLRGGRAEDAEHTRSRVG